MSERPLKYRAQPIKKRLEEFGEGMCRSCAMKPLAKGADEGCRHYIGYVKKER